MIRSNMHSFFLKSKLPVRFLDFEFDSYNIEWLSDGENGTYNEDNYVKYCDYYKDVVNNINKGNGLFLSGTFGTGKTALATVACKKYIVELHDSGKLHDGCVHFVTGASLVELFTYGMSNEEKEYRDYLENVDLLVIDEVSKLPLTKNSKEIVFIENIVRLRCLGNKALFMTSQCSVKDIEDSFSASFAQLVQEYFTNVNFIGRSYRSNFNG